MSNDNPSLNPPNNKDLPFFAYGIFKPGQLAYSRIEEYVHGTIKEKIPYLMLMRDGVPILDERGCRNCYTKGFLIYFNENDSEYAYKLISDTESKKLYKWGKINIGKTKANILFGRKPRIGSNYPEYNRDNYNGKDDPLFKEALDLIREDLENYPFVRGGDAKNFFRLQRNYILLWSAIERYASLKYGNSTKAHNNKELANEEIFQISLKNHVHEKRTVYRTYNLQKQTLDPDNPISSIEYYYTIRSNIVHKGKSIFYDIDMIKDSLYELLNIFQDVLDYTFNDSEEMYQNEY